MTTVHLLACGQCNELELSGLDMGQSDGRIARADEGLVGPDSTRRRLHAIIALRLENVVGTAAATQGVLVRDTRYIDPDSAGHVVTLEISYLQEANLKREVDKLKLRTRLH